MAFCLSKNETARRGLRRRRSFDSSRNLSSSRLRDEPKERLRRRLGGVWLKSVFRVLFFSCMVTGQAGQCLSKQAHRSAPGGSGAGGSVVILTKKLKGNPSRKISISGGDPVKCAFGAGGGKI